MMPRLPPLATINIQFILLYMASLHYLNVTVRHYPVYEFGCIYTMCLYHIFKKFDLKCPDWTIIIVERLTRNLKDE